MPTNESLLAIFAKTLDDLEPTEIWTGPSEGELDALLDSILESGMNLKEVLDWGESYAATESFESRQLLSASDLFRVTGHGDLIGAEQYTSIEEDVDDLLLEYAPSSSILVEDVLVHFSIEDQNQFDDMKNRRRTQRMKPS